MASRDVVRSWIDAYIKEEATNVLAEIRGAITMLLTGIAAEEH